MEGFRIIAGIGFFLLGMSHLREALQRLIGRGAKLFIKRHSVNPIKSLLGGALTTAVLQSSSMVNIMVLAFVGSGILKLNHALCIVLGSNIGTSLDSWLVAMFGFQYSIEWLALPAVGIGALMMASTEKGSRSKLWAGLLFGVGSVLLGLDLIKTGFLSAKDLLDFSSWRNFPLIFFLGIGFLLTALIQSSFAMVTIVLGALHTGFIGLEPAMAVVLGSESGTALKLFLAAGPLSRRNGDSAPARRLATANFGFNLALTLPIFFLIPWLINRLSFLETKFDPLIILAGFQSTVNLLAAMVFLPFVKKISGWLERFIPKSSGLTIYLSEVPPGAGEMATEALEQEARRFLLCALDFLKKSFGVSTTGTQAGANFQEDSVPIHYQNLKSFHGEILNYFSRISKGSLEDKINERVEILIGAVRNAMFSAKSIHDSLPDIALLANSSHDVKFKLYTDSCAKVKDFSEGVEKLLSPNPGDPFRLSVDLYHSIQQGYGAQLKKFYQDGVLSGLPESDVTTIINFNRELHSAYKAMVWSVKDLVLVKEQSDYFSDLPGFIR